MPALPTVAAEAAPAAQAFEDTGFEIGWDHAHYRLTPPAEHLLEAHPVRQGWEAGLASFGQRTLRPSPNVRKWLQLRLNAWARGCEFDALHVTPNYLGQVDTEVCPILRVTMSRATGGDLDASVDRVRNDRGYVVGNLVVIGVRANRAKGEMDARDALDVAARLEGAEPGTTLAGLTATQWARLAVLTSFSTPLPHAEACRLPLVVMPPNRLHVVNPAQGLQALLTAMFMRPGYGRRMAEVAALVPGDAARRAYHVFMHTLLARRVAAGTTTDARCVRHALEDAWRHPVLCRRWHQFAGLLSEGQTGALLQDASRRLTGTGVALVPPAISAPAAARQAR